MTTISGDTGVDKATNQAVKDELSITGTAPVFGCRAWVNFDGTRNVTDSGASVIGQNVKIRASGNVSSVFKNAVGVYTVNFTTAMLDANYVVNINEGVYQGPTTGIGTMASASCGVNTYNVWSGAITAYDISVVTFSVFG